jgi:YHS domain-containing protein
VCRMEIDPGKSLQHTWKDHQYYFCSPACRQAFLNAPGDHEGKTPPAVDRPAA